LLRGTAQKPSLLFEAILRAFSLKMWTYSSTLLVFGAILFLGLERKYVSMEYISVKWVCRLAECLPFVKEQTFDVT